MFSDARMLSGLPRASWWLQYRWKTHVPQLSRHRQDMPDPWKELAPVM